MKTPVIMIHGDRNSGKTRLMYAICSLLDLDRYSIGGMIQVPVFPGQPKTSYTLSDQLTGISRTILDEEGLDSSKKIGKYYICQDSFDWANSQIEKAFSSSDFLIFDEIGLLEIQKGGFYPSFSAALREYKGTIMMIVRNDYIDQIYSCFEINDDMVLSLSSALSSDEAYEKVLSNE